MGADAKDGELSIYVERMARFIRLLQIYEIVLKLPKDTDTDDYLSKQSTMMGVVYSFFYSLIERDEKSIDFFRIWLDRAPEMKDEIDALQARIEPMREGLRLFRNRFGFHGSTTREHESKAFDVLAKFDGNEIYGVMLALRDLSTKLLRKRLEQGS